METLEELEIKLDALEIRYENGSIDEDLYERKKKILLDKLSKYEEQDFYWVYEPDDND